MDGRVRTVLYARIDAFYAAVEQKTRPELAGKPVAVAAPKGNTSGVVISASKQARERGVAEGLSVRQAGRVCPGLVVIKPDYALYNQFSDAFLDVLSGYTPLLEPEGPGCAYMDITGSSLLFGEAYSIASNIIIQMGQAIGMPVHIGCAANKLVAKATVDPIRLFNRIKPGHEKEFLAEMQMNTLDVVTPVIEKRLGELGVYTVGRLASIPDSLLCKQFGAVLARSLKNRAIGIDFAPVRMGYPVEVINIEHTFEPEAEEPVEVETQLDRMAYAAQTKLRDCGRLAGEIILGILPAGQQQMLPTLFRFKKPTDDPAHIHQTLVKMLGSIMTAGQPVERVRVSLSGLARIKGGQLALIGPNERETKMINTMESIRKRFGDSSMRLASSYIETGREKVYTRAAA